GGNARDGVRAQGRSSRHLHGRRAHRRGRRQEGLLRQAALGARAALPLEDPAALNRNRGQTPIFISVAPPSSASRPRCGIRDSAGGTPRAPCRPLRAFPADAARQCAQGAARDRAAVLWRRPPLPWAAALPSPPETMPPGQPQELYAGSVQALPALPAVRSASRRAVAAVAPLVGLRAPPRPPAASPAGAQRRARDRTGAWTARSASAR